jgi:hypothetical protein
MGIGHQALAAFEELKKKNFFQEFDSAIDLGSQNIEPSHQNRAKDLIFNKEKIPNKQISTREFYENLGFSEYISIDADGERDSLVYDLNQNLKEVYNFDKQFDFVTNLGTSEHVFNQKVFFENAHNLTKKNGAILHILPFEGGFNHGYFNYQPSFFYDLALFNNYEIINFWYFSERPDRNFFKYYGSNYKPLDYSNDLINYLDELSFKNKLSGEPSNCHSSLAIIYRKKNNENFKDPFQSQWISNNKLKNYKEGTPNSNEIMNINKNIDHKKQIDDELGGGYWKNKLIKFLSKKNYRNKVIKILLQKIGFKIKIKDQNKYWLR